MLWTHEAQPSESTKYDRSENSWLVFFRLSDLQLSSFIAALNYFSGIFRRAAKKLFYFLFSNRLFLVSFALFSAVFSNVGRYISYKAGNFSFSPPKTIISSLPLFNFLGFCWAFYRAAKKLYN